jgi:dTDP-glucose pyrophosphorylase
VNNLNDVLVRQGATLRETLECITKSGKQLALVVDADGRLVGLATDGDLRKAILRGVSLEAPVEQAMNATPLVAERNLSSGAALVLMRRRSIRQLPLVDAERRVVDLLFLDDLVGPPSLPNAAVIMAGGEGKRLRPLTESTPKPLLRVGGKPLLEIMIERLRASGIHKVLLVLHYKSHMIKEHFGDGARLGVRIEYHYEDAPRGTAGSLHEALKYPGFTDHPLLVINGDILTKCNFKEMLDFHTERRAHMTVGTVPYTVDLPYGILEVDGARLAGVKEKPSIDFVINSGIYVVDPLVLVAMGHGAVKDMPELIADVMSRDRRVVAFPIREYWLDVGRLDDFHKAERDVAEGLLE